jgi:tetratricopeptide (TPR) repeat protein
MSFEETLAELQVRMSDLRENNLERSSVRVANEIRRLTKAERKLIPYLQSSFRAMVGSLSLLQPEMGRDIAIELISLLESESVARGFQSDLPMEEYEYTTAWMTACAYDNLAKCVAATDGFNSEGMHQCINDGIQVCRRTGKMECVSCFREYATEVYTAADDLDLAIHFATLSMNAPRNNRQDRRWVGGKELTRLHMLRGDLTAAKETLERATSLIDLYHSPKHANQSAWLLGEELAIVLGLEPLEPIEFPARGENPLLDLRFEQLQSLRETKERNFDKALSRLLNIEKTLTNRKYLSEFFNNRLRVLAVLKMADRTDTLHHMSEDLLRKATAASDHLTLRMVKLFLDPLFPASPLPTLKPYRLGPFADPRYVEEVTSESRITTVAKANSNEANQTERLPFIDDVDAAEEVAAPLPPDFVGKWFQRCQEIMQDEGVPIEQRASVLRAELIDVQLSPGSADDVSWFLHCLSIPIGPYDDPVATWTTANERAEPHLSDGTVLNLLATVGFEVHQQDPEVVDQDRLTELFRRSLQIATDRPRSFFRAGKFYEFQSKLGDAERCYARAFRMCRNDANIAKALAGIYSNTERESDAIAVLDLAIRHGANDADLPWLAGLLAFQSQRYEEAIMYFDNHALITKDPSNSLFFRIACLQELERYEDSKELLAPIRESDEPLLLIYEIQWTIAIAGCQEWTAFENALDLLLQKSHGEMIHLGLRMLVTLYTRLWKVSSDCVSPESIYRLEQFLLEIGLAPQEMFQRIRSSEASQETEVLFFECEIYQPVDEAWSEFRGCFANQESWDAYKIYWGVLATNEEDARKRVLSVQSQCYPLPAMTLVVEQKAGPFVDTPGVLWQGYRGPG